MSGPGQFVPRTPGGYVLWLIGAGVGFLCSYGLNHLLAGAGLSPQINLLFVLALVFLVLSLWTRIQNPYVGAVFVGFGFGAIVWVLSSMDLMGQREKSAGSDN
jgi:hypothetical protein